MKTLLAVVALAGAFVLADTATEQWTGSNLAVAQARSSACFQNCANVRRWPASQCRQYCRGKTKRSM
jgi:homospermidine synthase